MIHSVRIRVGLFLLGAVLFLVAAGTAYRVVNTITALERVERRRDLWQRPSQVIRALDLTERSAVMDVGSGAGYFALRLSPAVSRGRVLALDIRRLSLFFLYVRAMLRSPRNIVTLHGRAEDPHVPDGTLDAVLVSNTYHEFPDPGAVLAQLRRSLAPGGRVAILDRSDPAHRSHHHAALEDVERELIRSGFEIRERHAAFIDVAGETWWLVVARKPS